MVLRSSARAKEIAHALSDWTPTAPSALTWFVGELRELMKASFVGAYKPEVTEHGWALEFMHGSGDTATEQIRGFRQFVARMPCSELFLAYNPYNVEIAQRNRALLLNDAPLSRFSRYHEPVYRAVGLPGQHQLRALACDGPRLLSWVGVTSPEAFTPREVALLQRLSTPLRRRLQLERQLCAAWAGVHALDAVLEALGRPAFVVGPRNAIEVANHLGRALLNRDAKSVLASIRDSVRNGVAGTFNVTRLTEAGCPVYVLAIQKELRPSVPSGVSLARERWLLTTRQTCVLELIMTGDTNKEIAKRLSCAEVTVENHITEIYRRSGARSRADVIRRVFLLLGA